MNKEMVYLCSTIVVRIESTCSVETDMNLQESFLNHQNRNVHDENPSQGRPFAGRRQSSYMEEC